MERSTRRRGDTDRGGERERKVKRTEKGMM